MPTKVWDLNAPDKDEIDMSFNKEQTKETNEWWTHKSLTNLDLSSNVLTSISGNISNLQDLTVLNVSTAGLFRLVIRTVTLIFLAS